MKCSVNRKREKNTCFVALRFATHVHTYRERSIHRCIYGSVLSAYVWVDMDTVVKKKKDGLQSFSELILGKSMEKRCCATISLLLSFLRALIPLEFTGNIRYASCWHCFLSFATFFLLRYLPEVLFPHFSFPNQHLQIKEKKEPHGVPPVASPQHQSAMKQVMKKKYK